MIIIVTSDKKLSGLHLPKLQPRHWHHWLRFFLCCLFSYSSVDGVDKVEIGDTELKSMFDDLDIDDLKQLLEAVKQNKQGKATEL